MVFVGSKCPAPKVDQSKVWWEGGREGRRRSSHTTPSPIQAMAYFIHVMEPVAIKDYVLVYFHTQTQSENLLDSGFFKQLYLMVDEK